MDFPSVAFDAMNETDVREEIVAPLIRHLGYRSGTLHNVVREQVLTYEKLSLGRRKATDPLLRGRADYTCEAGGRVRWIVEAKGPNEKLDALAAEQAWSYAAHTQVRAVYFCLTNGREFHLYQTSNGAHHPPVFAVKYEELAARILGIENLLSPEALLLAYPIAEVDFGEPLGRGLRSIGRITHGFITADENPAMAALMNANAFFHGGSIERIDGRLVATLRRSPNLPGARPEGSFASPDILTLESSARVLSDDPANPTVFVGTDGQRLEAGQQLRNLMKPGMMSLPFSIEVIVQIKASGVLRERVVEGRFEAKSSTRTQIPLPPHIREFTQTGNFEIHVS